MNQAAKKCSLMLLLAMFLFPAGAWAAIYTFIDDGGSMHFTNVPNDPRYRPGIVKEREWYAPRAIKPGNPLFYEDFIRRAANIYEVDPLLIKAVIKAESNFDCQAVSRKGAKGLMQLMPETAAELNVNDPLDPLANILGGVCYLRQLLERFDGNLSLALAAYNAGPTRVESFGRIPRIRETQQYVKTVLAHYQRMKDSSSPSKRWVKVSY
ncbi:MAG: transglycosylase SLT domain-containing protein [Desulfobulbaceae bacterium]|nr:transglycosylase SLT domain-containing protein [Desulfobulbaceae bacterium]HIJ79589.1 lytic transglycosylase domain-containing protein [Deltaproteobacteria bacterium]